MTYHVLETIVFHSSCMFAAHSTLQPCVCLLLNLSIHFMMTGRGLEMLELYPYFWDTNTFNFKVSRVLDILGAGVFPSRLRLICGFSPTFGYCAIR